MTSDARMYVLTISGDPEVVAFLKAHIPERQDTLADGRRTVEAINRLFGSWVKADVLSVMRPQVTRLKVKINERMGQTAG